MFVTGSNMKIGCDIGGVVKSLATDHPLEGAIDGLHQLLSSGHEIVFISKCGPSYIPPTKAWLQSQALEHIPLFFCDSYQGKDTKYSCHD